MTTRDTRSLIGQMADLPEKGLLIRVEILDIKTEWGRQRYLVTPVAGSGSRWVEYLGMD